jgi:hypothetical protein
MSLPLCGVLGRAQLGAAELGSFQTVATGAGIPIIFAGGTVPQEKKKKKRKRKKRVKLVSDPRRREARPRPVHPPIPAPVASPTVNLPDTVTPAIQTALRETEREMEAARKLKEQIAEEDELLLLVI